MKNNRKWLVIVLVAIMSLVLLPGTASADAQPTGKFDTKRPTFVIGQYGVVSYYCDIDALGGNCLSLSGTLPSGLTAIPESYNAFWISGIPAAGTADTYELTINDACPTGAPVKIILTVFEPDGLVKEFGRGGNIEPFNIPIAFKYFSNRLWFNGNELDTSNYSAEEGSTIITLHKNFIDTLPVGLNVFTAQFDVEDEEMFVNLTLTIMGAGAAQVASSSNVPQTNAVGSVMWQVVLLIISIAGLGAMFFVRKRLIKE